MTGSVTKRVSGPPAAANTSRVTPGEVQSDRYDPWGDSWRLSGSIESCWGLTWIHRLARSVINVTDRVSSTSITAGTTKRVTETPQS